MAGLVIDASTPAVATNTVASQHTISVGPFTPPAGSLLAIRWGGNIVSGVNPTQPTITDDLGTHLVYNFLDWESRADTAFNGGNAASWWAVGTGTSLTITITNGVSGSVANESAMHVTVYTDTNGTPRIGAHGKSGSTSAATIAQNYTAQATGGQGLISVLDWTATGNMTAGTGCTLTDGGTGTINTNQISYGFLRRTTADDSNGSTNTLNVTLGGTSTDLSWVYLEVLPAVSGGAATADSAYQLQFTEEELYELVLASQDLFAGAAVTAVDQNITANSITTSEVFGNNLTASGIQDNSITSSETFGNTLTAPSVTTGITSSEVFGNAAVTTTYTVTANGIPTTENFGAPATGQSVTPQAIPSNERVGNASVTATYTINDNSITSSESLGSPVVSMTVTPQAIPTSEQFGAASVSIGVNPNGIPSNERLGNAAVTATYTINANGISSSEVSGNAFIATASSVTPQGINGAEQLGQPAVTTTYTINAQGIFSNETPGNTAVTQVVAANSITTTERFGNPSITVITAANAFSIPSAETFGNAAITTTYTISANGIPSSELLGNANTAAAAIIAAGAISPSEQFGKATITTGPVTVATQSITTNEQFGRAQISLGLLASTIQAYGIVSENKIGSPYAGPEVDDAIIWKAERNVIYVADPTLPSTVAPDDVVYVTDDLVDAIAGPDQA